MTGIRHFKRVHGRRKCETKREIQQRRSCPALKTRGKLNEKRIEAVCRTSQAAPGPEDYHSNSDKVTTLFGWELCTWLRRYKQSALSLLLSTDPSPSRTVRTRDPGRVNGESGVFPKTGYSRCSFKLLHFSPTIITNFLVSQTHSKV
jgi:hypothetical protein